MRAVSLDDRYDLAKSDILLNGTQALVRLMLMQKERDRRAGLNTAGYVSGYRGSPLGAVDMQMSRASKLLNANDIRFHPGLNEDLAATAVWGTQQAELRGEGRFDGVFGLWYGKGPGVDRSGDVMRHANMAGTSRHGGVLMAMGDDHTGESSSVCHQSDWALVDVYMPVLSPAGVQEILDFGLYGYAMSRFSGLWAGLKVMKDTIEVTSVVDGSLDRLSFRTPEFAMPEGGLNIRLGDHWVPQEARIIDYKRFAAEAFANANGIDRRVWGKRGAKIGFVAAGKNWLDLVHALNLLGIDEAEALRLGITTYKIGQTFPLDMKGFHDWADGVDLIVVVEEKRKLIEVQIKEAIFDDQNRHRVYGWYKGGAGGLHQEELFPTRYALDPAYIAQKLGEILIEEGRGTEAIRAGLETVRAAQAADNAPEVATRLAHFCSGCPHNTSTKLPEGSRAYAGIGCHIMALWMDRNTDGFTHMGGEGANWIGEAPFSTRPHVFQNLGDGTYNHSGIQAIRAAIAADVNITYKILYNDAVAMTGGQPNEGGLTAPKIAHELKALGVKHIVLVHDPKEDVDFSEFPPGLPRHTRDKLVEVEKECREISGVSVIIYIQTCAAEKRRRRKRGKFPDPDRRAFINPDVCEGCGDCGVQSNCVSIVPTESDFGRKRRIDQSSCNKDFSCVDGFCPSFVTVEGARIRQSAASEVDLPDMPTPALPAIAGTYNVLVTGVGGTGVVTIGAVLAMAAHLDGRGAGMMEMAGLAQKGGAVLIHCRIAEEPEAIDAIRIAVGEADAVIGGDLVVSAGARTLGLMRSGRTRAVINSHEIITGQFTRERDFRLPTERLSLSLQARLGEGGVTFCDYTELSRIALGDSIYSNMMIFGAAWQNGLVPVSEDAIARAIELNGADVEGNKRAFALGRWSVVEPDKANALLAGVVGELPKSPAALHETRATHLADYQNPAYAQRFRAFVAGFADEDLRATVSESYHKLLAYKDEYEVARLHEATIDRHLAEAFEGKLKLTFHLAPPLLARKGADGRPAKMAFGAWVRPIFRLLVRARVLRGTALDPFGYTAERRAERAAIVRYEADMAPYRGKIEGKLRDSVQDLARLPLSVRGFGPVKAAAAKAADARRHELLAEIAAGGRRKSVAA